MPMVMTAEMISEKSSALVANSRARSGFAGAEVARHQRRRRDADADR